VEGEPTAVQGGTLRRLGAHTCARPFGVTRSAAPSQPPATAPAALADDVRDCVVVTGKDDMPSEVGDREDAPVVTTTVQLAPAEADHLELALDGSYATGSRYLTATERAAVEQRGALPDGTPWELPLALSHSGGPVRAGDSLVLIDQEAVPVAELTVDEVVDDRGGTVVLAGRLRALKPRSARAFERLRAVRDPEADAGLVVPTSRPLHTHDLEAARELADRHGLPITLLGLTGAGRGDPVSLTRALVAGSRALVADSQSVSARVAVLPLPAVSQIGADGEARLVTRLAARYGARRVLLPHGAQLSPTALAELPVPVTVGPAGPLDPQALDRLLDDGANLPEGYTPPGVEREVRRRHPPTHRRGLILLFSGLSGSGKSTLAAAVVDTLAEHSDRDVTVLDGDVVRTMLSAGLTFSRPDRELNVRRIGYVAAEVARHGGTAVCAPIAPYAATRAEVRAMVEHAGGVFVLVHVSTPLKTCETRDRKGLYAKARAGLIPEFTGVSDPYEIPDDADLDVDTSLLSVHAGVDRVLGLLRQRGLIRD